MNKNTKKPQNFSRGGPSPSQIAGVYNALPTQMKQDVNKAVANAAMNELSNVFASKFK